MSTLYLQVTSTPYFLWSTSRYFQEKKKKIKEQKIQQKTQNHPGRSGTHNQD